MTASLSFYIDGRLRARCAYEPQSDDAARLGWGIAQEWDRIIGNSHRVAIIAEGGDRIAYIVARK